MRLKKIKDADIKVKESIYSVNQAELYKGVWAKEIFKNELILI